MAELVTDPNDPRLGHGIDEKPVPQQDAYIVLPESERKGDFIRPIRDTYIHSKCRGTTTMSRALAETYAKNPKFYGATYCAHCHMHRPVAEFHWFDNEHGIGPVVGS